MANPAVASFVTNPGIPRGEKAKTLVRHFVIMNGSGGAAVQKC